MKDIHGNSLVNKGMYEIGWNSHSVHDLEDENITEECGKFLGIAIAKVRGLREYRDGTSKPPRVVLEWICMDKEMGKDYQVISEQMDFTFRLISSEDLPLYLHADKKTPLFDKYLKEAAEA